LGGCAQLRGESRRVGLNHSDRAALSGAANRWGNSFVAGSVNKDGKTHTNSNYDEAQRKSSIVEISGMCADTSWFWFSFRRKKSYKKNCNLDGKKGEKIV